MSGCNGRSDGWVLYIKKKACTSQSSEFQQSSFQQFLSSCCRIYLLILSTDYAAVFTISNTKLRHRFLSEGKWRCSQKENNSHVCVRQEEQDWRTENDGNIQTDEGLSRISLESNLEGTAASQSEASVFLNGDFTQDTFRREESMCLIWIEFVVHFKVLF